MAQKSKCSGTASLINGAGFVLAAILVLHIVFVLFRLPSETGLAQSVQQAAVPLALFFPGLVEGQNQVTQVLLDYGLAAGFWVLLSGVLARVFG